MSEHSETREDGFGGTAVRLLRWLGGWVLTLGIPLCIALFVHAFVLEPFVVPTGSMLETIQLDDRVWAEKVSVRFSQPAAGDVVLFSSPANPEVTLLKRVIATGGQTVDFVDGQVVVDGQVLEESYVLQDQATYPLADHSPQVDDICYPYTVPEGSLWLMGDNRANSRDSRYYGAIPVSSLVGRAFCIYWPLSHARWL